MSDLTTAKQYTCECSDPGCKAHKRISECKAKGYIILYRTDMDDETGTVMCIDCTDYAFSSGLLTTKEIDE